MMKVIVPKAAREYVLANYPNDPLLKHIALSLLEQMPKVEAEEVVHGQWEKSHDDLGIDRGWKCSHCKGSVYEMTYEPYQHCPHCGSKMDGGADGE